MSQDLLQYKQGDTVYEATRDEIESLLMIEMRVMFSYNQKAKRVIYQPALTLADDGSHVVLSLRPVENPAYPSVSVTVPPADFISWFRNGEKAWFQYQNKAYDKNYQAALALLRKKFLGMKLFPTAIDSLRMPMPNRCLGRLVSGRKTWFFCQTSTDIRKQTNLITIRDIAGDISKLTTTLSGKADPDTYLIVNSKDTEFTFTICEGYPLANNAGYTLTVQFNSAGNVSTEFPDTIDWPAFTKEKYEQYVADEKAQEFDSLHIIDDLDDLDDFL